MTSGVLPQKTTAAATVWIAVGLLFIALIDRAWCRSPAFDAGGNIERAEMLAVVRVISVAIESPATDFRRTAQVKVVSVIKGCQLGTVISVEDAAGAMQRDHTALIYGIRSKGILYARPWQAAVIWEHPEPYDQKLEITAIRKHITKVDASKIQAITTYPDIAIAGSRHHTAFMRLYQERLNGTNLNYFFCDGDWPMKLATESAVTPE